MTAARLCRGLAAGLWAALWLAAAAAATDGPINGHGVLWKVARDGVADNYLFGTMHTPDPRVLELPEPARRALGQARTVALELLIGNVDRAATAGTELAGRMVLTDGRTLDAILGEQTFDVIAEALAAMGLPRVVARRLRPWGAYLMLNFPQRSLEAGAAPQLVLDQKIERIARQGDARLVALETVEEHVEVFAGMAEADMVRLLERLVEGGDAAGGLHAYVDGFFETVTELYLAGDIGGIFAAWRGQLPGKDGALAERLFERLIVARNLTMVERMTPLLEDGAAFIAVGAAHLPGRRGVVNLLAEQGFSVTAVR